MDHDVNCIRPLRGWGPWGCRCFCEDPAVSWMFRVYSFPYLPWSASFIHVCHRKWQTSACLEGRWSTSSVGTLVRCDVLIIPRVHVCVNYTDSEVTHAAEVAHDDHDYYVLLSTGVISDCISYAFSTVSPHPSNRRARVKQNKTNHLPE